MLSKLPQDVVYIIFSFLYFTTRYSNIFLISKKHNFYIKKSKEMKDYKNFKKNIKMMEHDKHLDGHFTDDLNLLWEKYHKFRWEDEIDKKKYFFKVGDIIDAKDYVNAWCPAIIYKKKLKTYKVFDEELNCNIDKFKFIYSVRFEGWNDNYNEELENSHIRKLGYYTINPNKKLESLQKNKDVAFWCLIKSENNWIIERVIKKIEKKDYFLLLTSNDKSYKINKNNINEKISCFSNATVYLSNSNHLFYANRYNLYY